MLLFSRIFFPVVMFSALVIASPCVHAEIKEGSRPQKNMAGARTEEKNWQFEIGAGVIYGNKYEGSDNYEIQPIPQLSVAYKDGLFFANMWDGIGSKFFRGDNFSMGASLGYEFGRDEDDDKDNLRGMGEIDMAISANFFADYDIGPIKISGKVTTGSEDHGTTASLEIGTMIPLAEKFMLMASAGPKWADDTHMQTFFGVSPVQAERSGYKTYNAGAGIKSIGMNIGAFYSLSEHWDMNLFCSLDYLIGDAADSPLTKEEYNPALIFTMSYKF